MKPEIKKRWVAALRSGDYEQTTGELRDGTTNDFCCLGVLCDLAKDQQEVCGEWEANGAFSSLDGPDVEDMLPLCVASWAGLSETDPEVEPPFEDRNISLSRLNDVHNMPFASIAELIENQL